MEEILTWCCGLGSAYLTIKALRSFGTRALCFLALVAGVEAAETTSSLTVRVTLTSSLASGSVRNNGGLNWTPNDPEPFVAGDYWQKTFGVGTPLPVIVECRIGSTTMATNHVTETGGSVFLTWDGAGTIGETPDGTNHVDVIHFTNTNLFGADYEFRAYTNGVLWKEAEFYLAGGDSIGPNSVTNDVAWTWEIIGPGTEANDYRRGVVAVGSSDQFPYYDPGDGGSYVAPGVIGGNPFEYVAPQDLGSIPTNSAVADRQNAEALARVIQAQGNLNSGELIAQLEKNRTNSSGDGHNYSNLLQQIASNTIPFELTVNSNLNNGGTNGQIDLIEQLLDKAVEMGGELYTNSTLHEIMGDWIFNMVGFSTFTNDVPSGGDEDALMLPLGRGYILDLNLFRNNTVKAANVTSMRSAALSVATFLKDWISSLTLVWAFWSCFTMFREEMHQLNVYEIAVKNPTITWDAILAVGASGATGGLSLLGWLLLKSSIIGFMGAALFFIVGMLPVILVTYFELFGVQPFILVGIAGRLAEITGQAWVNHAMEFYSVIGLGLPLTVIFTAIFNVHIFRFYAFSAYLLVSRILTIARLLSEPPKLG